MYQAVDPSEVQGTKIGQKHPLENKKGPDVDPGL
jgi:hypothetical protein